MSRWLPLAAVSDCPPGSAQELVVADRIIALFRVDDSFYALDGICPHQGGPLGKGRLNGGMLTCPWHGWRFDVRTGQHETNASVCHPRFPVKVEEGQVFIDLEPSEDLANPEP